MTLRKTQILHCHSHCQCFYVNLIKSIGYERLDCHTLPLTLPVAHLHCHIATFPRSYSGGGNALRGARK